MLAAMCVFAVVVSPHGMRGKLTGCCPGDLVKQVYLRLSLLLSYLYTEFNSFYLLDCLFII